MNKPYVISAELDLIRGQSQQEFNIDKIDAFRQSLDADLQSLGKQTAWMPAGQLRRRIEGMADATSVAVVSLDDRYIRTADAYLGISRAVDESLNDIGYAPRVGYPAIGQQLDRIAANSKEVVIADDVVFSGEMMLSIVESLADRKVLVAGVICGIGIDEGIDKLIAEGIDVNCVQKFDDVEDEICERDFALVAGTGRRVEPLDSGALYFDDRYGRPAVWASIPEDSIGDFCRSSLIRNLKLLSPDMPMSSVGKLVGYGQNGNVREQIISRLEEER